ncbi:MAG: FtsX-like permease family protein, partial [Sphingobacteriaceae bacterium]
MRSGQFDKAVERFKQVVALKPSSEAYFYMGTSYESLNKKTEAIAAYTQSKRIFRVNSDINFGGTASSLAITPMPLAAALANNFPEVKKAVRLLHDVGVRIKKGNEIIQEDKVVYSDPNIFEVFTLPMLTGNPKSALTEPNSVVITASTAKRYFNKTDVIGQTLLINNHTLYKITGVIQNIPVQSHFNFDFFLSLSSSPEYHNLNWFNYLCTTYILLNNQADYKKLEAKLPDLIRKATVQQSAGFDYKAFEKSGNYFKLNLTPLADIHLQSNRQYELGVNGNLQYVYIFSAIALFILLIACINFINLSTARSSSRAKEVVVRKVLGSSRKNLMAQFLSESILVTLAATLIAFFAAWLLLPLFNQLSGKILVLSLHTIFGLLPLLLLLILIIGIVAGLYPAVFLSGFQPVQVLKGKLASGFKGSWLRNSLVVFQFATAIILIVCTLVIYNQLSFIRNKSLGYDREQVLVLKNAYSLGSHAKTFK